MNGVDFLISTSRAHPPGLSDYRVQVRGIRGGRAALVWLPSETADADVARLAAPLLDEAFASGDTSPHASPFDAKGGAA